MADFKVGDTVRLKSGGPHMTVSSDVYGAPPSVSCQWFDRDTVKKGTFPVASLQMAETTDAPSRRHA